MALNEVIAASQAEVRAADAIAPIRQRMTALMLGCLVLATAVLGRAVMIQVISHPRLAQMAKRQFSSKVLIRPRRGEIVDRSGERLAINVEVRSLAANPSKIDNPRSLAKLLARATDVPYKKLLGRIDTDKEFVWIKRHLTEAEVHKLRKWHVIKSEEAGGEPMGGLMLVKESKRMYPHGELAAHLLGDVNVDSEGLEGTELWQDQKLKGKVLSVNAIRDALGRPAFIDASGARGVQDLAAQREGETISLTIDAPLQYAVEQELKTAVAKSNARGGSVIVMNSVNGEILAMANYPTYNPNDPSSPPDRRRNRAITDGYEPGSTMKALLAASYLSTGGKSTDQVWGEMGAGYKVQGRRISEAEAHEKYGWLSLEKMIQVSSNVGAAKFALKLGPDKLGATLKSFGFGGRTGSGFPGEISGVVPPRPKWQPITTANVGFGQGVLVTPLQMARAYGAFLNGGWLVQPKLIRDAVDTSVTTAAQQKPKQPDDATPPAPGAPRRVLPEKVAAEMLDILKGPMREGGTGLKANLNGYEVAGKTGTAQKVDPATRSYSRSKYVASFIGTAIDVEPKLVIFAAVDEPRGVYYASETAAPLFRETLNAVATRFSMPVRPDTKNRVVAEANAPAKPTPRSHAEKMAHSLAKIGALSDSLSLTAAHPAPGAPTAKVIPSGGELQWQGLSTAGRAVWTMPSLKGLTPREVAQALQGHRLQLEVKGVGLVRTQHPVEGSALTEGESIVKVQLGE